MKGPTDTGPSYEGPVPRSNRLSVELSPYATALDVNALRTDLGD